MDATNPKRSRGRQSQVTPLPVKRKQGRPPHVENPKERILEFAAEHFARQGYENSSINELAKSLKISKAAIYHYYNTKQEIYDEIIIITLRGMIQRVEGAVEVSKDPVERLKLFMSTHGEYFQKHYWEFVTMLMGFGGMINIERKNDALRLRDHYESFLRKIIADGVKAGRFKDTDVHVVARAIISMLGWMARWYRPSGKKSAADLALEYYDLIIGGLLADKRSKKP